MAKKKILIVEDDKHISKLISYNLEKNDFVCTVAESGEAALRFLGKTSFDLVILDIMLPNIDGFEVCRSIKRNDKLKDIPIVMLTARGEEIDRIVGLELGADDYMVKPFSPRELILRVKAILKRKNPEARDEKKDIVTAGDLVIDRARYTVTVKNKEIQCTRMEFNLLALLVERRGRIQTREKLLADVWNIEAEIYPRTVDTHIKRLRKKLGRTGDLIETIVGVGYRFKDIK